MDYHSTGTTLKRRYGGSRSSYAKRRRYQPSFSSIAKRRFARRAGRMAYGGRNRIALRNIRTGGLLGVEHKFLDVPMTSRALVAPTDATGGELQPTSIVTGCLTAPAQGDGPQNREGNKIVIDSILLQGTVSVPAQADQTNADVSCTVFLALVLDTQTNGSSLNSEDVFTNPAGSALLAPQPNRNMSYTSRFKVLAMKRFNLRIPPITYDGTNIEQAGFTTQWKLSWKGKIPVTFTTASTTADVANVTNNSVQLVGFCSNTELVPVVLYNARVRFYG